MTSSIKVFRQIEPTYHQKQFQSRDIHKKSNVHTTFPVFTVFQLPSIHPRAINKSLLSREITHINFSEILMKRLSNFNTVNVATYWHRLARNNDNWKIPFYEQRLQALIDYTYKILDQFNAQELANIFLALLKLGCIDTKTL